MRYFVVTTKHHEGFCLWDSQLTDYKATNTPAGRDLLRPMVEAFRAEGMRVGFYHSLLDWHHPDFPVDGFHPQRGDEEFKRASAGRDVSKYRAYLHGQVRELLTGYGKIDYIFFEFSLLSRTRLGSMGRQGLEDRGSQDLPLTMVRKLQPGIVVNDRLDVPGDVTTPEQYPAGRPCPYTFFATRRELSGKGRRPSMGVGGYDSGTILIGATLLNCWPSRCSSTAYRRMATSFWNVSPLHAGGEFDDHALSALHQIGSWMRFGTANLFMGAGPAAPTPRRTAATRRRETGFSFISSHGRLGMSTYPGWRAGSTSPASYTMGQKYGGRKSTRLKKLSPSEWGACRQAR